VSVVSTSTGETCYTHLYISYRQLYKFSKILSHLYLRLPMRLRKSSGSGKMPSRLYPYMPIVHSGFLHGRIAVTLDLVTLFVTFIVSFLPSIKILAIRQHNNLFRCYLLICNEYQIGM